jgi:diguanylate cyclase (GGDEF)-like protein
MTEISLEDARSADPVERLMEDSWSSRWLPSGRRELLVELAAGALFLACAVPLALASLASHHFHVTLAVVLVLLYAITSRLIKFPIGAGYLVPTYLVLVPMLLLLPPGTVPLLAAGGLVLGTACTAAVGAERKERVLFAIPDGWHALGPALVLLLAGERHAPGTLAAVYVAAFAAGCLLDLLSGTVREWAIRGITSGLQLRVHSVVWLIDACIAPLGLLVAIAMRQDPAAIVLILPLNILLLLVLRDRNARIEQAQSRLELVANERRRLQAAVGRLGDALAVKLDVEALTDIVLRGSVEALDAEAGRLTIAGPLGERGVEIGDAPRSAQALNAAVASARDFHEPCQLERHGVWALALPFSYGSDDGAVQGAVAVARPERRFREDEQAVMQGLVDRAREAAADIVARRVLREQALTDPLTKLGNRRRLLADADEQLLHARPSRPLLLLLFDLDGFKAYNDAFGHQAGDAMLARLGGRLATALGDRGGTAYRLGGDEFCGLIAIAGEAVEDVVATTTAALYEQGEDFAVSASVGWTLLPEETSSLDYAIQLADERMYSHKRGRTSLAGDQARDVLVRILHARLPALQEHCGDVARLCQRVGMRLELNGEDLEQVVRTAELHDVGKVGIPDAILRKAGPLTRAEWEFAKQHTLLGERILSAVPALRPIAGIVRATHERWDGRGYPDGLCDYEIPLAARIVAVCDAYEAMTDGRRHRPSRSPEEARAELRDAAGSQFDPAVVDAVLRELDASADRADEAVEQAGAWPGAGADAPGAGDRSGPDRRVPRTAGADPGHGPLGGQVSWP